MFSHLPTLWIGAYRGKKQTKKRSGSINLNDIYNEVASRADTEGVEINAAETRRVLACFFDVLEDHSPDVAFDLIAKGLKQTGGRRR